MTSFIKSAERLVWELGQLINFTQERGDTRITSSILCPSLMTTNADHLIGHRARCCSVRSFAPLRRLTDDLWLLGLQTR